MGKKKGHDGSKTSVRWFMCLGAVFALCPCVLPGNIIPLRIFPIDKVAKQAGWTLPRAVTMIWIRGKTDNTRR